MKAAVPMLLKKVVSGAAVIGLFVVARTGSANVYITKFCSDTGNNEHYEFVEFTNLGFTSVNMTGWNEDDSHAAANQSGHSLSELGTLAPGESDIFTEATPAAFRIYWWLSASVPVVGPYTNDNLSTTSDSITLFDSTGTLVDRLDYRTTNGGSADSVTRNAPYDALGKNNNSLWRNSYIGDAFGSFSAPQKPVIIGNPGTYPVLEPATIALSAIFGIGLMLKRSPRKNSR